MEGNAQPIGVFDEWSKLKEVLVGDASCFTFPRWAPDWGRYHGYQELLRGLEGTRLSKAFPDKAKGIAEQTENLVNTLAANGVVVHRPRLLSDSEMRLQPVGLASQFARDPQIVIGKHIIETNLRMSFRNKEHLGFEQLFRDRLALDADACHVRMPDTTPVLSGETEKDFLEDPRPFIEGGDTFVLGKNILVGFSSLASSPAGVTWLQRYLDPEGYQVHLVPLTVEWLHLDCIFSVIREGLCMCYMEGLKEGRLPDVIRGWEVIEATAQEAHELGCNTLCIEPGVVLIGAEHKRLIKEIEKRKGQAIPIPFDKPSEWGGGIRCSTHPLLRESSV